jgi:uncharacterized protein YuzE
MTRSSSSRSLGDESPRRLRRRLPMNFIYSTEADALYIELQSVETVDRTIEMSPRCLVDLDEASNPVGIELIHPARSYLDVTEVVSKWGLERQMGELLAYPYQSLSPRRSWVSSSSRGQVEVHGSRAELKVS